MQKCIAPLCLSALFGLLAEAQAQSLEELEKRLKQQQAEEARKKAAPKPKAAAGGPRAGGEFRDSLRSGGQGPAMVRIPGGRFEQGSPSYEGDRESSEGPVRSVSVLPFSLGKYEVTRGEFRTFVNATGYGATEWRDAGFPQDDSHPVVRVSWEQAQAYVEWLRRETGKPYRLPSESELEYANRAGTTSAWPWGSDGDGGCRHANYGGGCNDGYKNTAPVGSFLANAFGLHDTTGNVWEWTQDCYHDSYNGAPANGSAWTSGDCSKRVLRGGSSGAGPQWVRAAYRGRAWPAYRLSDTGLRLAQD